MLRPLAFTDVKDGNTLFRNEEFMAGDNLLVCPVSEPGSGQRYMYLPQGTWYDYFNDERLEGGREISREVPLESMPLFVKAGAVLPHYPVMQYVGEKRIEALCLHVYYAEGKVRSQLYEDSGDGYEYKKGEFSLKSFTQIGNHEHITLRQHTDGKFETEYKEYEILFHGLNFEPKRVLIDDEPSNHSVEKLEGNVWKLTIDKRFEVLKLEA